MAAGIIVQVKLEPSDVPQFGQQLVRQVTTALDTGARAAQDAGKKIGSALNAGIEDSLRRARQLRDQLDLVLAPDQRHSANEAKERAHQNRLQAIQAQSAARLQQIEARKQAQLDTIRERAVQREIDQQRRLERAAQSGGSFQAFLRRYSSTIREAGESIQQAGFAALGLSNIVLNLGRSAVQAAIDIDRQVNALKALTGSAEAAERRFAQLVQTARQTPGLTTNLALTLDAQLRVLSVTERTIDRILPAIGKLNAISPISDPSKFVGNLVQLVTQNFERQDLKELVGNSPFAGELIRQIFNVDSPTNAKAIREAAKKLGLTSVDAFITAFAQAAENNPRLQNVTESLGTQIQKLQDRLVVALRPLGLKLLETLVPAVERIVPQVEKLLNAFSRLSPEAQSAIFFLGGLALAAGPVVIALGGLIQTIGAVGNLATVVGALTAMNGATVTATGSVAAFGFSLGPVGFALGALVIVLGGAAIAWQKYGKAVDDALTIASRGGGLGEPIPGISQVPIPGKRGGSPPPEDLQKFLRGEVEFAPELKAGTRVAISVKAPPLATRRPPSAIATGGGTGSASNRAAADALREREALARAQVELEQATAQSIVAVSKAEREEILAVFQDLRERGLITLRDFYQKKLELRLKDLDAERSLLTIEIANAQKARDAATGSKRVEIETQLIGLYEKEQLLLLKLDTLGRENLEEFKKASGELAVNLNPETLQVASQKVDQIGKAAEAAAPKVTILGNAFTNLFQSVEASIGRAIDGVTAKLGLFGSFVGEILKGIANNIVRVLFAGGGGAVALGGSVAGGGGTAGAVGGGGGFGGFLNSILGGGLFNVGARTPGINPNASTPGFGSIGIPGLGAIPVPFGSVGRQTGFGSILPTAQQGFSDFLTRIGLGNPSGTAIGALGSIAPLLGVGLGASLGGSSVLGNILGGIGGGAVGVGLSFGASVLGAGGGLGQAALAALGPIALIGVPLLVGAFLLGKASQRKRDEEASGVFLTQALQGIQELKRQVSTDQIDGSQAQSVFENQILGNFIQQISQLKTESVRKSRLTNQVRDLRAVYQAEIPPEIERQRQRKRVTQGLIPEFASGGIVPGFDRGFDSVVSLLRPGEMVLTRAQQLAIESMAGSGVFSRAGVPDAGIQSGGWQAFAFGGTVQRGGGPTIILGNVTLALSKKDATEIFIEGAQTEDGQAVTVGTMRKARTLKRF